MKRKIGLGILFSRSGTYSLLGEASRAGALKGIAQVNGDPTLDVAFDPIERDPGGNVDAYAPLCEEILRDEDVRHVVGCTTSWSRKEVIPALERMDGALWYPTPYEGFEASDRIVYTHGCPNQHLLPLMEYTFSQYGMRGYLTGSNYIWGWEMNRLAREIVLRGGGSVLGERYLPLGSTEVGRIVEEIADLKPDFVLNQLIGPSQYAFLAAMAELRHRDPFFGAANCPVLSCNLTECELPAIGAPAEGLISAGPWFRGLPQPMPGNFGRDDFISSLEAAAHASVMMLAHLLSGNPGGEKLPLSLLLSRPEAAQMGLSARTHHSRLPVAIAQVRQGAFHLLRSAPPRDGDPYLTRDIAVPAPLRVVK
ncbi:amino acid/amide ABC transporter substrate-binding protein, HAAT family [Poseidonocella pacifica]|uniref:Amino acid/amide ABC transporter substrate-binding protein, HAAT family n=1 Tax=Poseidonocella pacifica TaxID=871651 RepID=A0A1I0V2J3_9RHOB|nr:transporter substrate-binding protein [Poseidonocella pacifica]SFA70310.1 amino acid/amide ABC transporter substrate-binding protein, HAAT family [Poseidonocella pacifica]